MCKNQSIPSLILKTTSVFVEIPGGFMFIMGWLSLLSCLWVFIFRSAFCEAHLPPDLLREYLPRLIDVSNAPFIFIFESCFCERLCAIVFIFCSSYLPIFGDIILYSGACAGVFFHIYTLLRAWHPKDSL